MADASASSGEALPTGTVTFLFADVEGSTRLLEQQPEAMGVALGRYEALVRGRVEAHRGYVFEAVGDAIYAAFPHASDAVAAALQAQLALRAEPWDGTAQVSARMALHTGGVELRGEHYFGQALYRCARLMAAAHGGQVVLSAVTAGLVRDALPEGASLRGLGTHRLKDLAEPEQISQLVHPALPAEFAPLKSLSTLLNNLPVQLTSFVGRERELAEIQRLLGASRLVTLTGIGGTGKTRLALQVAAEGVDEYPDGVWLVELAALADPALVPQAVASVLGVREEPGRPLLDTLIDALRPKQVLLLLDNCEHLLDACARLAESLLHACAGLRVLATSRAVLGVAGEAAWRVPSLAVPDPQRLPSTGQELVSAVAGYEATKLFADRASAALPGFAVAEQNAAAIAQVCHRLDGIPLAIELAAARVNVLSVDQLATRLDHRFRLLSRGSRTALPRQQTLRAVMDWSYDLLAHAERALFNRLSAFAGGWTLEAAEAVCAGQSVQADEVPDLLAELGDKSLVIPDPGADGSGRYRMLETLREYGQERLAESGEAEVVRRRHAEHFLALAEQAEPELTRPGQTTWLQRLETEHDNLRVALGWSEESAEAELGWRLGGALWRFWSVRGYLSEGLERLRALLVTDSAHTAARAKALHGAGVLATQSGDYAGARSLFQQSLAIRRQLGEKRGVANSLTNLGIVARLQGDYATARALYEESLAINRELGDKWAIATSLNNLGNVLHDQSEYADARALLKESLSIRRELGDGWTIANSLNNLGNVVRAQGDYGTAHALYKESLAITRELGDRWAIAYLLEDLGGLAAAQGELRRALCLVAAAAALREAIGAPLSPAEQARLDRTLGSARRALGAEAQAAACAEGQAMSLEEAIEYALADTPPLVDAPVRTQGAS